MSGLELTLVAAALLAGVCGTWSPCGFSMIETIGPHGHDAGRATTVSACATFAVGALVGGVITFGGLAALGELVHGAAGDVSYLIAAALAVCAAVAELRGTPILPQLRRQLPEHWRRVMPMPVAAGLYGVLLGLGFTTFVLTFGVFALAGIAFALGDPQIGLAIGLAFGVGRAVPIALVAPIADRDAGQRITEAMAGRPGIYRGARFGDGLGLLAAAAALVVAVPAGAAHTESHPAADPAVSGGDLVFQRPNGSGVLRRGGQDIGLPGDDPALGGGRIAVIQGRSIRLLGAGDLNEVGKVSAPGADALAVSDHWLVWRARTGGRDFMRARNVTDPASPGPEQSLGRAGGASQLGRPSLDGNRLVYARATKRENSIVRRLLGSSHPKRAKTTLMRSHFDGLSNPSIRGHALLYVRTTRRSSRLQLTRAGSRRPGRTLFSVREGNLWSTALDDQHAYVTVIHGTRPQQRIISIGR